MASTRFQPHINGMRAIAILGVLFYHLNSRYCPAGYFGVDIFLVISGYFLLKTLLSQSPSKPSFNYCAFLARRVWRIYPAMLVLAGMACVAACIAMLPPIPHETFKISVISCFAGMNFYIDRMGGYFDTSSKFNPLLHFWYLGITLQLYVLAPLFLIPLARRSSRKVLNSALALIGLLSLAFYILTTAPFVPWNVHHFLLGLIGAKTAYYHLIPRLWEIIAGYFILTMPELEGKPALRSALAFAGLILCMAPCFLCSVGSAFPYPAVLGAMLLTRYGGAGCIGRMLSCKPMQWLGFISFSLYLWHWPIMVIWKYILIYPPSPVTEAGMVLASLVMGWLSWRWVERFTPYKWNLRPRLADISGYAILLLPLLSAVCYGSFKLCRPERRTLTEDELNSYNFPIIQKGFDHGTFPKPPCPIGGTPSSRPIFLLMGDSHALHLYSGLKQVCGREGLHGVYFNNSCVPYWQYYLPLYQEGGAAWNSRWAEGLVRYLQAQPDIKYVFIAQSWAARLLAVDGFDENNMLPIRKKERSEFTAAAFRKTCDHINAQGKKIILLADVPSFPSPAPLDEYNRCKRLGWSPPARTVSLQRHKENNSVPDKLMGELLQEGRIMGVIDLSTPLLRNGSFRADLDGEFLYIDTGHLSDLGSRIVAEYLIREFKGLIAQEH